MQTAFIKHLLPALPYPARALEPYIDAGTVTLRHDLHHADYVKALNLVLESAPASIQGRTADWLLRNPHRLPENIRDAVRHNAGGHVNHSLLWRAMAPAGGGPPCVPLSNAIDRSFGSFRKFTTRFEEAGGRLSDSGWVWLVRLKNGKGALQVLTTSTHANPLAQGHYPLLVKDAWEPAGYPDHQNRRVEYLKGWWSVVNWVEAGRRFERAQLAEELAADFYRDAPLRQSA